MQHFLTNWQVQGATEVVREDTTASLACLLPKTGEVANSAVGDKDLLARQPSGLQQGQCQGLLHQEEEQQEGSSSQ